MSDKFEGQIEFILKNFDFSKVVRVMRVLDWAWAMGGGVNAVPSVEDVKKNARKLLEKVASEQADHVHSIETGGLQATSYPSGYLELEFVIESESGVFATV